ncbi:MAG TPA: hypothetical protein VK821_13305, partial [Dehalococcoidia bacterium]|nr:hypothetical protein [Dehalococcoidia bacterium]
DGGIGVKRVSLSIAMAFGLALLVTVSVFASQDRIEGRPLSFRTGSRAGAYFWHDNPVGLSLRTTDQIGVHHEYTGTITTDGTFINISPIQLDPDDSVSLDGSGQILSFDFHTFSGVDGVDFEIAGGTGQELYIQWDGRDIPVARVYLGRNSVHPLYDPMMFCRDDNDDCRGNLP